MPTHITSGEIRYVENAIRTGQVENLVDQGLLSRDLMRRYQEHLNAQTREEEAGLRGRTQPRFASEDEQPSRTNIPAGPRGGGGTVTQPYTGGPPRPANQPANLSTELRNATRIESLQRRIAISERDLAGTIATYPRHLLEADRNDPRSEIGGWQARIDQMKVQLQSMTGGQPGGTPFTDFVNQQRIGGQQPDPTTTTPNRADALVSAGRAGDFTDEFGDLEAGPRETPRVIGGTGGVIPGTDPVPQGGGGDVSGARFGPFTQFTNRLGIGAAGGGIGANYQRDFFPATRDLYGIEQTFQELTGDVPGLFGQYVENEFIGDRGATYNRAGDILRRAYSAGAAGREAAGLRLGSQGFDDAGAALPRDVSAEQERNLYELALRPYFGAQGARSFGQNLPRAQARFTQQQSRGTNTEDNLADYLYSRFNLGRFFSPQGTPFTDFAIKTQLSGVR